jgi:hypothetical protein
MGKSIHMVLDPLVHAALRREARRQKMSVSKVAQRAIVAELKIRGVPVFAWEDLEELDERIPGTRLLPEEKMVLTKEDIESNVERGGKVYATAEELIEDLHHEVGLDS